MLWGGFEYFFLPAAGTCGGILIAWRSATWSTSNISQTPHNLTLRLSGPSNPTPWWLTVVDGSHVDHDKLSFISELRSLRSRLVGPWLLCGDFNLIYRTDDRFIDWWLRRRKEVHKEHRCGFDSFVAPCLRFVCHERNARIFDGAFRSVQELIRSTRDVAAAWVAAGFVSSCEFFS
jgi:hypothetical protein